MIDHGSYDVALIGAGPIGIELAVALKRAGMSYIHFDAKQIGYTISWFPPGTQFFSSNERIAIAGVPLMTANQSKATREEYLAYLRMVVSMFELKINTYEPVTKIERGSGEFLIHSTPRGGPAMARAKSIILSTGGTDRPRKLGCPGEDLSHVSHYFRDPHEYFGKSLLIIGGKNSAVEAALRCHHAGAKVAISYRRSELPTKSIKYWLMPEINGLIASTRIVGYFDTVPIAITPTHVRLKRGAEEFDVPADFVLALIGYEQDNALLKMAGIELGGANNAPTFDPQTMMSNVPKIYVAGTAIGGTQNSYTVFIENCHVHVARIVAALSGRRVETAPAVYDAPES